MPCEPLTVYVYSSPRLSNILCCLSVTVLSQKGGRGPQAHEADEDEGSGPMLPSDMYHEAMEEAAAENPGQFLLPSEYMDMYCIWSCDRHSLRGKPVVVADRVLAVHMRFMCC